MLRPTHRPSASTFPPASVGQRAATPARARVSACGTMAGSRLAAAVFALTLVAAALTPTGIVFAQEATSPATSPPPTPVQQAPVAAPSPAPVTPAQPEQPAAPAQPAPQAQPPATGAAPQASPPPAAEQPPQAGGQPSPAEQPQSRELVLVVLGDSLSAGYNLPGDKAFPAVLEKALRVRGHPVKVVNAGVSGDTTTGGLERLDWSVPDNASGVIVELGANDMLRGIDPAIPRAALDKIISRLKQRNIPVLLAGMRAAPNLGGRYSEDFEGIYQDLAKRHGLMLYPFFLDGVAGDRNLLLPDGMHPNPVGVQMMVSKILPTVEQFLASLQPR